MFKRGVGKVSLSLVALLFVASACSMFGGVEPLAIVQGIIIPGEVISPSDNLTVVLGDVTKEVGTDRVFEFTEVRYGTHRLTVKKGEDTIHEEDVQVSSSNVIVYVDPDADESLLFNWSFEMPVPNGDIPNWDANIDEIAVSDKYAYHGDYSVRFSGLDTDGTLSLKADQVPAVAGAEYTVHAYIYAEGEGSGAASPSLVVDFHGANGGRLDRNQTYSRGTEGTWIQMESKVTAPANTDHMIVHFHAGAAYDGTLYVDSVKVTRTSD